MTYLLLVYAVLATGDVQSGLCAKRFDDAEKCQRVAEISIASLLPPSIDGSPWQHVCIGVSKQWSGRAKRRSRREPKAAPTRAT